MTDEEILNRFDMNSKYGPCVGITRSERWDRANALGLNPPKNVKRLLLKGGAELENNLWHKIL